MTLVIDMRLHIFTFVDMILKNSCLISYYFVTRQKLIPILIPCKKKEFVETSQSGIQRIQRKEHD